MLRVTNMLVNANRLMKPADSKEVPKMFSNDLSIIIFT